MRVIPVSQIKVGQVLGQTLYNSRMLPALRPGIAIQENQIRWLCDNGYRSVYVDDGLDLDEPTPLITEDQFAKGSRRIGELFAASKDLMRMEQENTPSKSRELFKLRNHRDELLEDIVEWSGRTITDLSKGGNRFWECSIVKSQPSYPVGHALCTTLISTLMGFEMRLNFKQIQSLFMASILAEVGNLIIPQEILSKQGRLTPDEFEQVKGHCYNSYTQIKSCAEINHLIRLICLEHHERVDGTGYPKGLKDHEINILAKVLTVADAYDAMNSDRSYRQAYMPHKAMELMAMDVGTRYDKDAFAALKKVVIPYPVGTLVSLDDGTCGAVSGRLPGKVDKPIIRLIQGKTLNEPTLLSDLPERRITGIRHTLPDR